MKLLCTSLGASVICGTAWAVYAPIPEAAKGRAFSAQVSASVYHDTNIFASAARPIDSVVYRVAPSLEFNSSLSDQTFFTAGYGLTFDYVEDRPGSNSLVSHAFDARLGHAFSDRSQLTLTESYRIARNPESLLPGVAGSPGIPLNTDQSFKSNEFGARMTTSLSERLGLTFKGRSFIIAYDDAVLAASLDRDETLLGGSVDFLLQPTAKLLGEYRYQWIDYDENGGGKDKRSHFLLAGVDYGAGPKLAFTSRAGLELRRRSGAPDEDAPYLELTARYAYGEKSYVAGGYVMTIEETSNVRLYTDTRVNRFFVNVAHALTPRIVASGLFNYEPSELQGRPGFSGDRDETTTRVGLALSYEPTRQWLVTATVDYDDIDSDDLSRDYDRTRVGVSSRFAF